MVRNTRKEKLEKRRGKVHWLDVVGYGSILLFIIIVAYLAAPTFQFGLQSQTTSATVSQVTRAAVIDQLSSVQSGSSLISWTVGTLRQPSRPRVRIDHIARSHGFRKSLKPDRAVHE